MAAEDWVFKLRELPAKLREFGTAIQRVARPIFNSYVIFMSPEEATKQTLQDMAKRRQNGQLNY